MGCRTIGNQFCSTALVVIFSSLSSFLTSKNSTWSGSGTLAHWIFLGSYSFMILTLTPMTPCLSMTCLDPTSRQSFLAWPAEIMQPFLNFIDLARCWDSFPETMTSQPLAFSLSTACLITALTATLTGIWARSLSLIDSAMAAAQRPFCLSLRTLMWMPSGLYPHLFWIKDSSSLIFLWFSSKRGLVLVTLKMISGLGRVLVRSKPEQPQSSSDFSKKVWSSALKRPSQMCFFSLFFVWLVDIYKQSIIYQKQYFYTSNISQL